MLMAVVFLAGVAVGMVGLCVILLIIAERKD